MFQALLTMSGQCPANRAIILQATIWIQVRIYQRVVCIQLLAKGAESYDPRDAQIVREGFSEFSLPRCGLRFQWLSALFHTQLPLPRGHGLIAESTRLCYARYGRLSQRWS